MDPYKGGAILGEAIFGGGTPGAYEKQVRSVAQSESAVQQARRARSLALIDAARQEARSKISADLLGRAMAGDLAAQSELGASVLGGNQTMSLGQLGKFQQPRFGEASNIRADALGLGEEPVDVPLANRAGAYLSGKDYQPIRAEGGAYIADGATLGDLDMVPTLPTLNTMQRTEASIAQGQQRTNAAVAKSGRTSAGAGRPATTAQNEARELAQAREAVAQGADPIAVANTLKARGFANLASKIYVPPKTP